MPESSLQLLIYLASVLGAAGLCLVMPREKRLHGGLRTLGTLAAVAALGVLWIATAPAWIAAGDGLDDGARPFYYVFSALGIAAAVRVITHTKPVYSALYFVLVVVASSGLFLTLSAEFMAAAMVIIYGGAILVTYMFVIMLATQSEGRGEAPGTGRDAASAEAEAPVYERAAQEPIWAAVAGFLLLAVLLTLIFQPHEPNPTAFAPTDALITDPRDPAGVLTDRPLVISPETGETVPAAVGNTERIGLELFQANPLAIELAGVILLLSLIGAVVIAQLHVEREDETLAEAEAEAEGAGVSGIDSETEPRTPPGDPVAS